MIVDTMSYEEVASYLIKTCFSQNMLKQADDCIYKKWKKYVAEIKKWQQRGSTEKYRIFKLNKLKSEDMTLYYVPYASTPKFIDSVRFSIIRYRRDKYVAFLCKKTIIFFTWHSLQRYAERFLNDKDASIDETFIGDMLIYNTQYAHSKYEYKNRETSMMTTTDGSFLGFKCGENVYVAKTFISEQNYFCNQSEIDKEAIDYLKDYKMREYNDTIYR